MHPLLLAGATSTNYVYVNQRLRVGGKTKMQKPGEEPGEARVEVPRRSPAEAQGEEVVIWKACPWPGSCKYLAGEDRRRS